MMRISTTAIESFRLFSTQDWMTEEQLIDSILRRGEPSYEMLLGKAFDAVLTDPVATAVENGYRSGDFFFHADVMDIALARIDRRGVCQVKATKDYGDAQVVCVADQLIGAELVENKTTTGTFQFDKYQESCQWRFMADIFTPRLITYNVFLLGEDSGTTILRGIESFRLYPYESLHADCSALVSEFVAFARLKGLESVLQAKHAEAAA